MKRESKKLIDLMQEGFEAALEDSAKRKIVVNAMNVFSKKGLHATRISDIAKEAGFSQGFVYNHYKSKDAIFTAIVKLASQGGEQAIKAVSGFEGTPYEKIYWLTEALLSPDSLAAQHFQLVLLQTTAFESMPPEAQDISKTSLRKPLKALLPIIMEGQRSGEIVGSDPIMLATAYFAFIRGLALTRSQAGKEISFPTTEMILSFLKEE